MDNDHKYQLDFIDHPVVPRDRRDGRFLDVVETHFLSSDGYLIKSNPEITPLWVSHREPGKLDLASYFKDKIYSNHHNPDHVALNYKICNYGNPKNTLINTVYEEKKLFAVDIPERMLETPIWSTWAKFKTQVNESVVLNYASDIKQHYTRCSKNNCGQMEIDDKWQTDYGDVEFDLVKFPDPKGFVDKLHDDGFTVTVWTTPFINKESKYYKTAKDASYFVNDNRDRAQTTKWWQCPMSINPMERNCASMIDFTNPSAFTFQTDRFNSLIETSGIDGFKFDAGEIEFLQDDWRLFDKTIWNSAEYNTEYAKFCAQYGGIGEVRAAWQLQKVYPGWIRMLDLWSQWGPENGLRSVIPKALTFTIAGYPWVMPDMVGGNVGGAIEEDGRLPSKELYIRWLELANFLPVVQYSIVPWDFDDEHVISMTRWQIYGIEMSNRYSFGQNLTSPYLQTYDVT